MDIETEPTDARDADDPKAADDVEQPRSRRFPLHGVRMAFRCVVLALFLFDCVRLLMLYAWANGAIDVNLGRPQLSAGLSPLSGLFDLRTWALTGEIDPVLPASMVIVIVGLVVSLGMRRAFCSWMCPVGTILDALDFIGRKLFSGIALSKRAEKVLRAPKTVFGVFVLVVVIFLVPTYTILMAWQAPYWSVSDMAVLKLFVQPGAIIIVVAIVVLGLSLLLGRNFWCTCLCPLGAIYGLVAKASPVALTRDDRACIGCGACAKACPAHLSVDISEHPIRTIDCTGCMECAAACPQQHALEAKAFGRWRVPLVAVPLVILGLWLGVWGIAVAAGAWYGQASPQWVAQAMRILATGAI